MERMWMVRAEADKLYDYAPLESNEASIPKPRGLRR